MRILQLTNKPPFPARDGGSIAILNLTRGFSRLNHQVTVLSMNTLKHHVSLHEIPVSLKTTVDFRLTDVPATISPSAALGNLLFSKQPYNAVRFISKSYESELINLLREKEFDIIQLEGLYLCPYIPVIRENSSTAIAYRAHNIESEIWHRTAAISKIPKRWYLHDLAVRIENFERKQIDRYDLLIPITSRDGHILNSMGNSRPVHVAPAGVEPELFRAVKPGVEFPSLFHIGALDWAPNQEGLLWFIKNCWKILSEKHPDLRFYIAGRNAPAWLSSKFNHPGIVFLGEVDDAYEFMGSKSVMVVPLLSGSGMRVKIIEGMALGKAIVTTTTGAEGLPVVSGEHLLIADHPTDFIANIGHLIDNRNAAVQLGNNASLFAKENFDYLSIAGKLASFYENYLK